MSAAKARTAKRKAPAKQRVRKISLFDRFLRTLPFSEAEIQRGFTFIVVAAALVLIFVIARASGVTDFVYQKYADIAVQAGFQVKRVEVNGMKRVDEIKVYDLVLAEKDRAMPLVDVEGIRQTLLGYGWIEDARVSRRLPDTLVVEIFERQPAAVWQQGNKLSLVDQKGEVLENVSARESGTLPRLYGTNANKQVAGLQKLLDEAPSLKTQVIGASWVGNRRWDLAFKSGETLALPEGEGAAKKAIVDFARMDGVYRLLGRDIIHFDMRDPDRAYLRRKKETAPLPVEGKPAKTTGSGDAA